MKVPFKQSVDNMAIEQTGLAVFTFRIHNIMNTLQGFQATVIIFL